MCEELTLLPCPACKNTNVVLRAYTRAYGFCTACGMCGPCAPKVNAEYAIRQWNALPRDLTWTDEPPKEVGNYWWRWDAGSKHWIYNVRLIPTIHGLITYDHSAYDAEHVEDIGGQWAGPIPEPREPKQWVAIKNAEEPCPKN